MTDCPGNLFHFIAQIYDYKNREKKCVEKFQVPAIPPLTIY